MLEASAGPIPRKTLGEGAFAEDAVDEAGGDGNERGDGHEGEEGGDHLGGSR